jgi:isocitrate lyase
VRSNQVAIGLAIAHAFECIAVRTLHVRAFCFVNFAIVVEATHLEAYVLDTQETRRALAEVARFTQLFFSRRLARHR